MAKELSLVEQVNKIVKDITTKENLKEVKNLALEGLSIQMANCMKVFGKMTNIRAMEQKLG